MASSRSSFLNRSVVVTGGASGIGRAIGHQLTAAGAHVVLADIDAPQVAETADAIGVSSPAGGSVVGRALDVRDRSAVSDLVADVVREHDGLDYLFNNAGISMGGPTETIPADHWDRIIDVNLVGVVNGVLAAYPSMKTRGSGHIVNTASAAGLMPAVFAAAYSSTKHAVVGLSGSLRTEAAAHGVRVSVLCPGMVETPILDRAPPSDLEPRTDTPLSGRAYLESVGMKPVSAERLARAALRGVERNRAVIVVPASIRAGWLLSRASPRAMEAFARFAATRVRRAMGETTPPTSED